MMKQVTTYETKMEYDENGKVIRKVVTETCDVPVLEEPLKLTVPLRERPSVFDIISGITGIALIATSICFICSLF